MPNLVRRLTTVLTLTMYVSVSVLAAGLHHHHQDDAAEAELAPAEDGNPTGWRAAEDDDGCCSLCAVIQAAQDVGGPFVVDVPVTRSGYAVVFPPCSASHLFPLAARSRAPPAPFRRRDCSGSL